MAPYAHGFVYAGRLASLQLKFTIIVSATLRGKPGPTFFATARVCYTVTVCIRKYTVVLLGKERCLKFKDHKTIIGK
jgi:hypothetical protein